MAWIDAGALDAIPRRGARVLHVDGERVAVFRTSDDKVFALRDACPHQGGPLSQGIVHGNSVTGPLHDWDIDLATGRATGPDEGSTPAYEARIEQGRVLLDVIPAAKAGETIETGIAAQAG
jgi:nitrite reductase (NADH) small subunit